MRLLQARAIENLAFVVGVNRCGADPTLTYDGRSVGFDPHGNCLFEANAAEQVILADIDVEQARQWRAKFPALKDMRASQLPSVSLTHGIFNIRATFSSSRETSPWTRPKWWQTPTSFMRLKYCFNGTSGAKIVCSK